MTDGEFVQHFMDAVIRNQDLWLYDYHFNNNHADLVSLRSNDAFSELVGLINKIKAKQPTISYPILDLLFRLPAQKFMKTTFLRSMQYGSRLFNSHSINLDPGVEQAYFEALENPVFNKDKPRLGSPEKGYFDTNDYLLYFNYLLREHVLNYPDYFNGEESLDFFPFTLLSSTHTSIEAITDFYAITLSFNGVLSDAGISYAQDLYYYSSNSFSTININPLAKVNLIDKRVHPDHDKDLWELQGSYARSAAEKILITNQFFKDLITGREDKLLHPEEETESFTTDEENKYLLRGLLLQPGKESLSLLIELFMANQDNDRKQDLIVWGLHQVRQSGVDIYEPDSTGLSLMNNLSVSFPGDISTFIPQVEQELFILESDAYQFSEERESETSINSMVI